MKMDKLDLLKYLDKYEAEHKKWPTYYEIELIKEEEDRFPIYAWIFHQSRRSRGVLRSRAVR